MFRMKDLHRDWMTAIGIQKGMTQPQLEGAAAAASDIDETEGSSSTDSDTGTLLCLTNTASLSGQCTPSGHSTYFSANSDVGHGNLSIEQHLKQSRQPLWIYQGLPYLEYQDFAESFKLFRCLYFIWKATGEKTIMLDILGKLIRNEDPLIFYKNGAKPKLTNFLNRSIQRKFPISWLESHQGIDFEELVDLVEEKEAVFNIMYPIQSGLGALSL